MRFGAHLRDSLDNPIGVCVPKVKDSVTTGAINTVASMRKKRNNERKKARGSSTNVKEDDWRDDPTRNPCHEWDVAAKQLLSQL
jgi:hypothetical protein